MHEAGVGRVGVEGAALAGGQAGHRGEGGSGPHVLDESVPADVHAGRVGRAEAGQPLGRPRGVPGVQAVSGKVEAAAQQHVQRRGVQAGEAGQAGAELDQVGKERI